MKNINTNLIIALENTDDGRFDFQDNWAIIHNERKKIMMSASDVALAGLSEKTRYPDISMPNLTRDFEDSWVITSTQTDFCHSDKNLADIVHYVGSNVIKPIIHKKIFVPVIQSERMPIEKVLFMNGGLNYLEKVLGLKGENVILDSMTGFFGRHPNEIYIFTPTLESRAKYSKRAVRFGGNGKWFLVDCDVGFDKYGGGGGRSYTVHASEIPRIGL